MMKTAVLLQMALLLFAAFTGSRAHRGRRHLDENGLEREDIQGQIRSPRVTNWGNWSDWDMCPPKSFAVGMTLKVESAQHGGDDTGLNGIRLTCLHTPCKDCVYGRRHRGEISGNVGPWGQWGDKKTCGRAREILRASFIRGFSLRSDQIQGGGNDEDDTAANNLKVYCDDEETLTGEGAERGKWSSAQNCPSGTAVCGLRTQVEDPQGPEGDDTALNNVDMKCCYVNNYLNENF